MPRSIVDALPEAEGLPYTATGISLVLHPCSPYAPSFHANFRYFGIDTDRWWFGGGADLQTGTNIEAVLMSLPPMAAWAFDTTPEPGSPEADLTCFLRPRDWIGLESEKDGQRV